MTEKEPETSDTATQNANFEAEQGEQILRQMLNQVEGAVETLVDVTSKFCSKLVCTGCVSKKRRNPESPKVFIRVCVHCEEMFLRKILFEEFWNEKGAKEAQIGKKRGRKEELEKRVRAEEKEKNERRQKEEKTSGKGEMDELEKRREEVDLEIRRIRESMREKVDKLRRKEEKLEALKKRKREAKKEDLALEEELQNEPLEIHFFLQKFLDQNKVENLTEQNSQKTFEQMEQELLSGNYENMFVSGFEDERFEKPKENFSETRESKKTRTSRKKRKKRKTKNGQKDLRTLATEENESCFNRTSCSIF